MKWNIPLTILTLSLYSAVQAGDIESYTATTAHHDLHHDLSHDTHHDLHHDLQHDLHHGLTHDLHHHDLQHNILDHHNLNHHVLHTDAVHHHHADLHTDAPHHHHADLHTELHHHDLIQQHGHHLHHSHRDVVVSTPHASGFWKKSFVWKPRWVKSWQEKKVYVGVWKHVWGPVQVTEWVPIPKPPPGWTKH